VRLLERQLPGETSARRIAQLAGFSLHAVPIALFLFRARWEGLENVPRDGPAVIAANHNSVADASLMAVPIFLTQRARLIRYVAALDQYYGPWGRYIRFFSALPVDISKVDWTAYRDVFRSLEAGRLLGMFPEGGISKDGRLRPFRAGAAWIALNAGVPLVPVTINGMFEIWPRSHAWPRYGHSELVYHPPIPCQDLSRHRFDRQALEDVNRRLEEAVRSRYVPPSSSSREDPLSLASR